MVNIVFKWITSYVNINPDSDSIYGKFVPFNPESTVGVNITDTYIKRLTKKDKYRVAKVRVEVIKLEEYWGFFYKQYRTTLRIGNKKKRFLDKDLYNLALHDINICPCVFYDDKTVIGILVLIED